MATQGRNEIDMKLAASLKELASKHPMEKITIKDITDLAGVIRPTFYNHFQDKYELLEWIMNTELLEPVIPLFENGLVTEAMVLLFANIEKDRAFYSHVVRMEGPVNFHEIAQRNVQTVLLEVMSRKMSGKTPKYKWLTPEVVATYYAQSMCFVMEAWVRAGMPYTPQEMAEAYHYMVTRSMEDVIREL